MLIAFDSRLGLGQAGPSRPEPASAEVELLTAARAEPVEIEAYVFKRLREQGRHIPAKLAVEITKDLRQRASTADYWLPTWPASSRLAPGYSALAASSKFGLSGLDIFLSTLTPDKETSPASIKRIIAELPRGQSQTPTCELPVFSCRIPLYRYLNTYGKQLYVSRDDQLAMLGELAAGIDSPYDLASIVDFVSRFEFLNPADFSAAQSQVTSALGKVEMPPCGGEPLLSQFGFAEMLGRVIAPPETRGGLSTGLLLAYRAFAVRAIKGRICAAQHQPDGSEVAVKNP